MSEILKRRIALGAIFLALLVGVGMVSFYSGFRSGAEFPKTLIIKDVSGIDSPKSSAPTNFSTFWEAWDTINSKYLKSKDIGGEARVYGAIRGLVGSLGDPHSEFFSPPDNKKFQEDIEGNFGGIGAEIGIKNERLLIVAPLKDTPASKSGLRPGDYIIEINSTSTTGLQVNQAVQMIRGKEGTAVVLSILRDGWEEPKDFKITREVISVPTLDFEMKGDIAHVEFHSFNSNLTSLFYNMTQSEEFKTAKGMVLDLRNDPGGYLGVAVDMAGRFLPQNTLVLSEEGTDGKRVEYRAKGDAALTNFPVVLLVNEGSASASEILAGALRDQRKIKIVGKKTYGKGTVQEIIELHDGSSLKLTIAHWVLPSGKILEGDGLKPDVAVELTDADIKKELDPQLDKAIEVLRGEISKL